MVADNMSRVLADSTEWSLNLSVFQNNYVDGFGMLNIDLFASRLVYNAAKFVSREPDPLCFEGNEFSERVLDCLMFFYL